MSIVINKKVRGDVDPKRVLWEIEETRTDTATYAISIEHLEKARADFQAKISEINEKIAEIEKG